jgi:hypothetical protein
MTTFELDDQLRTHYASFRVGHAAFRDRLLERIASGHLEHRDRQQLNVRSVFLTRRWLMRSTAAAAAVVAIATSIPMFFSPPGGGNLTWAEVVTAVGPIESVQFTVTERDAGGRRVERERESSVSTCVVTARDFLQTSPSHTFLTRWNGPERVTYTIEMDKGHPTRFNQWIEYTSPRIGPPSERDRPEALAAWDDLRNLSSDAVLKRGSEEVDGTRLIRFEVVNPPKDSRLPRRTTIWVNPKTKQPVMTDGGGFVSVNGPTRVEGIRFNQPISEKTFEPPALPDDIDAEVVWQFQLPSHALRQEEFTFAIRDAKGTAIVDEKDMLRSSLDEDLEPGDMMEGGVGAGGASVGGPGMMLPERSPRFLKRSAVDALDRYMALHAGETVTIEIADEKPIHRVIFGRLNRSTPSSPLMVIPIDPPPSTNPTPAPGIPGGRGAPSAPGGFGATPPQLPGRPAAPRFSPRGATSR